MQIAPCLNGASAGLTDNLLKELLFLDEVVLQKSSSI